MTILVTGAAGFIGKHLLGSTKEPAIGIDQEEGGLANYELFERLVFQVRPRRIIHLAAISQTGDASAAQANAYLTFNVLRAALEFVRKTQSKCKIVVAGSASEYGDLEPDAAPPNETAELRPIDMYGRSKAASSLLAHGFARWYGLPVTVLRFANVYGPGQVGKFIPAVIDKLMKGERVTIASQGTPRRQWVFIEDVIAAIIVAAQWPESGIFNVGHPAEIPNGRIAFDIAEALEERLGTDLVSFLNPVDEGGGARRVAMNVGKISRVLGWKATTDITTGLRATVAAALAERGQS